MPAPRGWALKVYGFERTMRALAKGEEATAVTWQRTIDRRIKPVGLEMLEYASKITHRITGTLASAYRLTYAITGEAAFGTLSIAEDVVNPVSGQRPVEYGVYEHARGGDHAFFERTFKKFERRAATRYMNFVLQDLPKGE